MTRPPVLASARLLRALTAATYIGVTAAGAAVLHYPPVTYVGTAYAATIMWGVVLLVFGAAAALGALVDRLRVLEWAACYMIAGGLVLYAVMSWVTVADSLGSMPRAWLLVAGIAAALARGTQLAIENWQARQAALIMRHRALEPGGDWGSYG